MEEGSLMEEKRNVTWEYMSLINELNQGMEKAKQLRFHICLASDSDSDSESDALRLLQRIISSFDKAFAILKSKSSARGLRLPSEATSDELNRTDCRDHGAAKKRKLQTTWTQQVRVSSDNGLEGPADDGYSWRKYGQKDILGAKYPRSYYRCTYRSVLGCWATKQVQRSDEDPTVFEVTYKGEHTCSYPAGEVPEPPSSLEKPEMQQNQALMNLKTNLRVSTDTFDAQEMTPTLFSFPHVSHDVDSYYFPISNLDESRLGSNSPLFISPATSESKYLLPTTYEMSSMGVGGHNYQHSDCEIISANASTTNSPIGGTEFQLDLADLDPGFPFNTAGFFS
ncbi:probable WRKY transcription factor 41 [Andrographis paniculata]|uniref:probable WRKY transcription factor 41 n=1 Tax=Andrographis paniculata TaxID=175694 RepID=UPI0021E75D17|nr:probable WRKY transcription factor 41 [Andrographis paniculata]